MPLASGFRALLCALAQIFLQQHPGFGLAVLLALLIGAPDLLGDALLGALAGNLVAQRKGYAQADIDSGLYGYNGALIGLLLSLKLAWTPLLPLLVVTLSGLSCLLLHPWMRALRERQWLPAYTLPFVLCGWTLPWLAGVLDMPAAAINTAPTLAETSWQTLVEGTLRGLGQVIFLDHPLAGLCLLVGLLLNDPRAGIWALCAAALPVVVTLLNGPPSTNASLGLLGYSPVLAVVALSQLTRQPWAPLAGLLLSLILQPGFAALGLPPLTMPFILACWLVLASTRLLRRAANEYPPLPEPRRIP